MKIRSKSYKSVNKYRNQLRQELKTRLTVWRMEKKYDLIEHFEQGGLDRFRIGKKHSFDIYTQGYIYELAEYMAAHHKRPIDYYLVKYNYSYNLLEGI